MFHFYNILLLSIFFTYSLSNYIQKYYPNRTIVSSRSIYDLVQIRRAAARLTKLQRNNNTTTNNFNQLNKTYTPRIKIADSTAHHNQYLIKRLKIVITISRIAVGFMIILVLICIAARYYRDKYPTSTERAETRESLNSLKQKKRTTRYIRVNQNTGNFSRKQRTLPTAV